MFTELKDIVALSSEEIGSLARDAVKTAEAVNLIYVRDAEPGIRRVRKGKQFYYLVNDKRVTDKEELERIKKLVIPPTWENVWICRHENGHLQATGLDLRKRKQYRYHPLWNALRNHTKFYRLYQFGLTLPKIRQQVKKDLSLPGLPLQKILALVLNLMEQTNIRVGNGQYEKLYGSYGLTTLKDKHVKFTGNDLQFIFKGKKGVHHNIRLRDKRLVNLVKKCRDIPGKELFQYMDEQNGRHSIDSGMVNEYIKKISGCDFTAKDFRTWSGSLLALLAFRDLGCCDSPVLTKKKIVEALDMVSEQLGNTRSVCKKYYVHPVIVSLYESRELEIYFRSLGKKSTKKHKDFSHEEEVLMKLFKRDLLTQKQKS